MGVKREQAWAGAAPRQGPQTPWHSLPPEQVYAALHTRETGLSPEEAARRLVEVGRNVLERRRRDGPLRLLWRQVRSPLIWVLLGASALAAVLGKGVDALVVLAVVVLNTVIGFVQELRAGKAIEALAQMVPQSTQVVRGGAVRVVPAAEVVPGDVVLLASGDRVPADARLVRTRGLQVDEAALTGESVPVQKRVQPVEVQAPLAERTSMAFGGTLVASGTATAVVVATGARTELGRISDLLEETTELRTPLTRAMASVGRVLTGAILGVTALLLGIGLLRGYPLSDALVAGIALAVAAIPEGLPAIITIALAIGVQRMAARRAVIRSLPSVETLGSTTVICTDKTGTLTRNEMTVQALWTPEGRYTVSGVGYAPEGALLRAGEALAEPPADAQALLQAGLLCNDAVLRLEQERWTLAGDPTEGALVVAAAKAGLEERTFRERFPRLDAIPFESERQFMATLHAAPEGARHVFLKGAPEAVLPRCSLPEGLTPQDVHREVEGLASHGMRVLAVADKALPPGEPELHHDDVHEGLRLLGLQGMMDPPRPEAISAVRACREAGIRVKMMTGDHQRTAEVIGAELGILEDAGGAVTGARLEALDERQLEALADTTHVFARVAPEHKLRLVRALQRRGQVVAMTGDGVNDAPALKQANIGVAMGITGTSVSKEAADVVLADDNFATIEAAVEEGRRIYDNLVKSLAFVLPTNLGLALILMAAVAFFPILVIGGERVPLLAMQPTQLLWINLVATVALALPLAFEALEPDVMRRPPRAPGAPILGRFVVARTVLVALLMAAGAVGLFLWEYWRDVGEVGHAVALREAQTMAVTTVIMFQLFYLMNCRSLRDSVRAIGFFSNPAVFLGAGALVVLQLGFIYLPFMQRVFGTAALGPCELLLCAVVGTSILPAISLEKAWRARRAREARAARAHAPRRRGPPPLRAGGLRRR